MNDQIKTGATITETLRRILRWCDAVGERMQFAGEGGERRFRYWLMRELLEGDLGWPVENTAQGERFDVTLLDDSQHPLISIETKTPYHLASAKERRDFEARLSALPTLRYAIFTNGSTWQRYQIDPETRVPLEDDKFTLGEHTELSAFNFFEPLRYAGGIHRSPQAAYRIARGEAFLSSSLLRLTADMEATLADGLLFYQKLFEGFRHGFAGPEVQSITSNIYERWAGDSLHLRPSQIAKIISEKHWQASSTEPLLDVLSSYDFENETAQQVAEAILSMSPRERKLQEKVVLHLWPLFEPTIRQLCAQTAHVQLARVLLYRIGEDEGVFERRLSGEQLRSLLAVSRSDIHGRRYPITEQIEDIRRSMQDFLPSVYVLSEFDWWMVKSETRPSLTAQQRAWLVPFDEALEHLTSFALERLGSYKFEAVDLDVWRNLYENYLPPDERQRLGAFYTPDPLVGLTLDLAGYKPEVEGLCDLSFIDPACGSGAFVSTALGRLQQHLDLPLPCHDSLHNRKTSSAQKLETRLRMIESAVHGIDIHPFASFLTTLNVLFTVLPSYVKAREANPDFSLSFGIYAWDALDQPGVSDHDQRTLSDMWTGMNSRIQRSSRDHEQYRQLITGKFDRVFGNPPWGGVLNGPLAPVYDGSKKRAFASTYPQAAQGKYDIYGLFIERAVRLLKEDGKFALITQSTFLDKEWASGLRGLLASEIELLWIVEMNPFGQLFFQAMNAPCITVAAKTVPNATHSVGTIRSKKTALRGDGRLERQAYVASTLRSVAKILESNTEADLDFASGVQIPQTSFAKTAKTRWNLAKDSTRKQKPGWSAAELLEVRQGVTPGNCLDLFLLTTTEVKHHSLEKGLVHRAVKSRDLKRWSAPWHNLELLYPYHKPKHSEWVPAFTIDDDTIAQKSTKAKVHSSGLKDSLDFETNLDEYERGIVQKRGITSDALALLLKHRIAEGLVAYPETARYLVQNYKRLEKREFKHRNIRKFNRRWYEYLWPRDPKMMLSKVRILSPTLMRSGRFVLDERPYLSDHACLFLQPSSKTSSAWDQLGEKLSEVLETSATQRDILLYCLAHLNSPAATLSLTEGHQPTPKGSYQVSEKSLGDVIIPVPKRNAQSIIDKVESLVAPKQVLEEETTLDLEQKLFALL